MFAIKLILGEFMKILITGSTSGIGFKTGIDLIKKGHFVYFTVHRDEQINTVKDKLKALNVLESASIFKLDITKEKDRKLIYDLDIDVLVCNASIGYGGGVLDISIDKIKENFNVNVISNVELIQTYAAHLFLTGQKGKIIVMSSLAGTIPIPFLGSYCATKASLSILTSCFNKELKLITEDIKIKLIEPGIFNTGFNEVMLENKDNSIYFSKLEPKLTEREKRLFNLIGCNNLGIITNIIIKAINSDSNKLVYSAPFLQKLGSRVYSIFR